MSNQNEDRRRFFRITDAIGVSYTLENADDETVDEVLGENINVQQLLGIHNQNLKTVLSKLEHESPLVAAALIEMDKKLDTVIALLELENKAAYSIQQASISACGIAFPVDRDLAINTMLKLTLYLETSGQEIKVLGRVVGCQNLPEEGVHYLRVEFTEMNDMDREKLIQHIVQRQGLLLRSLREQMEG